VSNPLFSIFVNIVISMLVTLSNYEWNGIASIYFEIPYQLDKGNETFL